MQPKKNLIKNQPELILNRKEFFDFTNIQFFNSLILTYRLIIENPYELFCIVYTLILL